MHPVRGMSELHPLGTVLLWSLVLLLPIVLASSIALAMRSGSKRRRQGVPQLGDLTTPSDETLAEVDRRHRAA